jgi:Fe2+ or Zn2+ uptake regulation protein
MQESEKELLEMLQESEMDVETLLHSVDREKKPELSDPQVLDIVMYVIRDLADEGKITCSCPDGGDYDVEIFDDHLTVKCKQCGDSLDIPTNSLTAANDFLACESLDLE